MRPFASVKRAARSRAEEQLILVSAGTAARRQAMRDHAQDLSASVDWSLVAELLRMRRLLPTLGPRILELAGDRASDDFAAAVAQATDTGRRQGAFLQLIAERVMAELAASGIRCTPLKGPLLSEALYGDPGRRPSSDIDLLVAEEQLRNAVKVVRWLGYEAPTDHVGDGGLPLLHFALIHQRGEWPPVELHWRVHWYERRFARERLLAPPGSAPGLRWRPAPVDELVALLLFYARDGFIDLRHATDIGAWWDMCGARLPPNALERTIRAYPALERVLLVAARVVERTVGLPADRLFEFGPRPSRRDHLAARLANPHPQSSQAQLYADMGLIDGLLTPSGGFRAFIRRQVAPPRQVVRERTRTAGGRRVSSTSGYGVRVLCRYGLAMTRLFRAPETLPLELPP